MGSERMDPGVHKLLIVEDDHFDDLDICFASISGASIRVRVVASCLKTGRFAVLWNGYGWDRSFKVERPGNAEDMAAVEIGFDRVAGAYLWMTCAFERQVKHTSHTTTQLTTWTPAFHFIWSLKGARMHTEEGDADERPV